MSTNITITVSTDCLDRTDVSHISIDGHGDIEHYERAIRAILTADGFAPDAHLDLFEEERQENRKLNEARCCEEPSLMGGAAGAPPASVPCWPLHNVAPENAGQNIKHRDPFWLGDEFKR